MRMAGYWQQVDKIDKLTERSLSFSAALSPPLFVCVLFSDSEKLLSTSGPRRYASMTERGVSARTCSHLHMYFFGAVCTYMYIQVLVDFGHM